MEQNIKTIVEAATRHVAMGVVKEMIKDVFPVGFDELKEGMNTRFIDIVVGAFIDIVEQGHGNTILVLIVDTQAESSRLQTFWRNEA